MKRIALLCIIFLACLLPSKGQTTGALVTPSALNLEVFTTAAHAGSTTPNAYQARLSLTFALPNVVVTSWGSPVRDGVNINVTIAAQASVAAGTATGGTATMVNHSYDLGALPLGSYNFRVFSGSALVRSFPVVSAQYPPSLPATADVVVYATNPASVSAAVTLQFTQAVGMRPQPVVSLDSAGRYVMEAIADRLPDANVLTVLPPPFKLTYTLGAVPVGTKVAVFKLNGVTLAERSFTVAPTAPEMQVGVTFTKNATTAGISVKAHLEFSDAVYILSNPGVATRAGNTFTVQATADAVMTLVAQPIPRVFEPVYNLGLLSAGSYHLNYLINGVKKGEYDFTVEVVTPPAPIFLQDIAVQAAVTGQVANVTVAIGSPATTITDWGSAVRDGAVFTANLTSTTSTDPVTQVVRAETHAYALGTLTAGSYTFVQKVDGREIGRRTFAIASAPEPRFVYLKPISTTTGYQVEAAISLPAGMAVSNWGTMSRVENQFTATVTFGAATATNAGATGTAVILATHVYDLGNLERGVYQVVLRKADSSLFGSVSFAVAGTVPPPPPPDGVYLASLNAVIDGGTVRSQLAVNITNPASSVLDWGTPVVSGNTVNFPLTIGPRPTTTAGTNVAPLIVGPHLEMHTYNLGALTAGNYTFIVSASTTEIGRREITVGSVPPPPPPPTPVPNVAYVKFGATTAGRTAEVGILLPTANLEVTDWGTVAPVVSSNTTVTGLKVCITVGESAPPTPTDPPVLTPTDPTDPGVIALTGAASSTAAGASPVRLVTHVYDLGALTPGAYNFIVCIGDRNVVTRPFVVENTATAVTGSVLPSNIEAVKAGSHLLHLQFKSPNGMTTAAGAGVTVAGPNGFAGTATFKSEGIISMDPLGMILNADFEVSTADGSWDAADSGVYQVNVAPSSVTDKAGKTLINSRVGAFNVRIWPTLPPTPLPVTINVAQAEGVWQASVTITTAATIRPWKLKATKPVLTAGSVLNLGAELEPGTAGTDPAQLVLTYNLGALPPGNYRAVFKSNVGHCGAAAFVVAGEEPPSAIGTWQQIAFTNGAWSRPEVIADLADPDGDGTPNITEYCLGTDPVHPDVPEFRPTVERDANGNPHLVILFRRVIGTPDAQAVVAVSRDLKTWQPAGADVELTVRSQDIDGTEQVCACQKAILGQAGSWPFMRLTMEKVTTTP